MELRLSLNKGEARKKFTDLIRTATLVVTPFGRDLSVSSPMYCIVKYKHEGKEKTLRVMGGSLLLLPDGDVVYELERPYHSDFLDEVLFELPRGEKADQVLRKLR